MQPFSNEVFKLFLLFFFLPDGEMGLGKGDGGMGNAFGLFFSGMSALTTFDRTSLRLVQRRFRIALGCTFCLSGKLAEVRSTCHSRKRFLENVSPRFFNAFDLGGGGGILSFYVGFVICYGQ